MSADTLPGRPGLPRLPGVRRLTRAVRADALATIGAVLVVLIVAVALLAPWVAPYPADALGATDPLRALQPPSTAHWFGTDQVGRDILSRVIFGARTSVTIVLSVLVLSGLLGVAIGVVGGYAGGWLRDVLGRFTDVVLAFPPLLLALALAAVLSPGITTIVVAISASWWTWYARLSASVAGSVATRGYVVAARCLGEPHHRIVRRHVLPNSITPVVVQASLDAGGILLTAAALSFLGLGAREPTAEWGLMVEQGQALATTHWWVMTFPGLAILTTAFACNLLGEGLRATLDPHRRVR